MRTRVSQMALLALVLASALGGAGCALDFANKGEQPCTTCFVPAASSVSIELYSSNLGQQEQPNVLIDPVTHTLSVTPQALVTLSGHIKLPADLPSLSLHNAVVIATRPSRIVGRPDVLYQGLVNEQMETYAISLIPTVGDEKYTIQLAIDNAVLPPFTLEIAAAADTQLDLVPEAPATASLLAGYVKNALGTPIVSAPVHAEDAATGAVVSTLVESDATGHYAIAVSSAAAKKPLLVVAQLGDNLRVQRAVASLTAASGSELNLEKPALPNAVTQTFAVSGKSSAGVDVPVVGAAAIATVRIPNPNVPEMVAIHQLGATSDPNGNLQLALYPQEGAARTYDLSLVTPATSEFQSTSMLQVQAGATPGYGSTIMLDRRRLVTGTVLGPDFLPIVDALIATSPTTLSGAASVGALIATPQVSTDADGRFALRVDQGDYDLSIKPRPADRLAPFWMADLVVADVDVALDGITLPAAAKVVGRVADAQALPVAGVTVRVFATPDANKLCARDNLDCLRPVQLYAELTSRSDGTFDILLPAAK